MKICLKGLIYIIVSIGCFKYVKESFTDYLSYATNYAVTEEPISLSDLPALTICLEHESIRLTYDEDFVIDVEVAEEITENATLQISRKFVSVFGLHIVMLDFSQLN